MRFLRSIQRREDENPPAGEEISTEASVQAPNGMNEPAGLLAIPDLRIGAPKPSPAAVNVDSTLRPATNGSSGPKELRPVQKGLLQDLPSVREIVVNAERVNPRLVSIIQPRSPYCEEYRNLRTQLLHKNKTRKLQAIVVASVGPSEGKSITALNLSWLFAQTDGVRALIIDSDLRRPSLAENLGFDPNIRGLSEVLIGSLSLKDALLKLQPAGLYLLPGGAARNDVAELISGPRFAEILEEARNHFDYIIIDAPPLGIFTDASLLINLADGAMLVIRANHTKYKDVDRILDSLPSERMLGTILNQSDVPLMDESYYKYTYYDRNLPV